MLGYHLTDKSSAESTDWYGEDMMKSVSLALDSDNEFDAQCELFFRECEEYDAKQEILLENQEELEYIANKQGIRAAQYYASN